MIKPFRVTHGGLPPIDETEEERRERLDTVAAETARRRANPITGADAAVADPCEAIAEYLGRWCVYMDDAYAVRHVLDQWPYVTGGQMERAFLLAGRRRGRP